MPQSNNICPLRALVANIMNPTLNQPPATRADVICTCSECLMHKQLPWHRRYYPCIDARAVVEPLPRPKEVPNSWSFQPYGPIDGTNLTCRHAKWLEDKESMVKRNTPQVAGYCGILARFINVDSLERVHREAHNLLRDKDNNGVVDDDADFGALIGSGWLPTGDAAERFMREDRQMRRDILEDD